jgi:cellulose synthase/poly-beta-1,6-N-acetylglucosamine synthase-like glycosyltransferase
MIWDAFFIIDTLLLCCFFFYRKILKACILIRGPKEPAKNTHLPKITVIIPTYNEGKNIRSKLENLYRSSYPNRLMKIIVSDDGSSDNTVPLAKAFSPHIIVLCAKKNRGKTFVLNSAIKKADSDIIVITDADSMLRKDTLFALIKCFSSSTIGGVTGNISLLAKESVYRAGQERFQAKENMFRDLEGTLDSVSSMDGRLCAFRKSIISSIDPSAAADDLVLAHQIRRKGFFATFAKNAHAKEYAPPSLSSEFAQKRRRSLYTIAVVFQQIDMFFNPKYGYFGLVIFPFRRVCGVLSPFLLAYALTYMILTLPILFVLASVIVLLGLLSRTFRGVIIYNSLVLASISFAWLDYIMSKGDVAGKWKRTYSNPKPKALYR